MSPGIRFAELRLLGGEEISNQLGRLRSLPQNFVRTANSLQLFQIVQHPRNGLNLAWVDSFTWRFADNLDEKICLPLFLLQFLLMRLMPSFRK